MAASKGYIGKGTVLKFGSTAVAQLKTLQFAGQKINFEDISNLDSPVLGTSAVPLGENLPNKAEPGTMALAGIFLPSDTGQLALETAYLGAALSSFSIQLPMGPGQTTQGNLYAFSGYIVEQPLPDVQFDKTLTFKTTIQVAGAITITPGS